MSLLLIPQFIWTLGKYLYIYNIGERDLSSPHCPIFSQEIQLCMSEAVILPSAKSDSGASPLISAIRDLFTLAWNLPLSD